MLLRRSCLESGIPVLGSRRKRRLLRCLNLCNCVLVLLSGMNLALRRDKAGNRKSRNLRRETAAQSITFLVEARRLRRERVMRFLERVVLLSDRRELLEYLKLQL